MRQFWKFAKPTGPGFGIGKRFYLSVLANKAVLPSVASVVNPKGANGAIEGFGVPLVQSKDKTLLEAPMIRGGYALASTDRKTVLRLMVMSADEAGFSPEAIAKSKIALTLDPELLTRIRSTWHLLQVSFESHDPDVYPSLDFLLGVVQRLGNLSDGVIADPLSERYLFPNMVIQNPRIDPTVDAREHIYVHSRLSGGLHKVFTRGLFKFNLPELEIADVSDLQLRAASEFLIASSQGVLMGYLVQNGSKLGEFEAREGGFDKAQWEGIPVLELLPPTKMSIEEALRKSIS